MRNPLDHNLKAKGLLSINDICKSLSKGRYTITTVIEYLSIKPSEVVRGHSYYSESDFKKISDFYIEHPDSSKFLAREMRLRKYGTDAYSKSIQKGIETKIKKYGADYAERSLIKSKKTNLIRYGNPNYRNVEKSKDTLYSNRDKFCIENDCSPFSEIFRNGWHHSTDTFDFCMKQSNISLIKYKTVLYIKNSDIEILKNALKSVEYQKTSFAEKEVADFIKSLGYSIIENTRDVISPKELDVYVPSRKLAVEFDGMYYHSDNFVSSSYHLEKTMECERKGIRLIHIFEDEWNNDREFVKFLIRLFLSDNCSEIMDFFLKQICSNHNVSSLNFHADRRFFSPSDFNNSDCFSSINTTEPVLQIIQNNNVFDCGTVNVTYSQKPLK